MAARRLGALLVLGIVLAGCQPRGMLPGGSLRGVPAAGPVTDWSFAAAEPSVQVEALAGSSFRSGNVQPLVVDGALYLVATGFTDWGWLEALRRDPRARLLVQGKLYDVRAVHLSELGDIDPLLPALLAKTSQMQVVRPRYVGSTARYPGTQVKLQLFRVEAG